MSFSKATLGDLISIKDALKGALKELTDDVNKVNSKSLDKEKKEQVFGSISYDLKFLDRYLATFKETYNELLAQNYKNSLFGNKTTVKKTPARKPVRKTVRRA